MFSVLLLLAPVSGMTAKEAIADMGKGINFGNSWDGNSNGVTDAVSMNRIINQTHQEGFRTVRFTVTWSSGSRPEPSGKAGGTLGNLKQAVAHALHMGLTVVLNWHWNHPTKDNLEAFRAGWRTIAGDDNYFSRKAFPSERLIFEVLNEPNYDQTGGGEVLTRQVNLAGYQAIRSQDKNRIVLVMPDRQGNWGNLDSVYKEKASLPGGGNDSFLGVAVHSYDPWPFAGENKGGSYPGCQFYANIFKQLASWVQKTGTPVTMNEFGLQHQPRDSSNDHCYLSLMSNLAHKHNMGPVVWNDYGGFGVIDKSGKFTNGNGRVVLESCISSCGCCP